MNVTQVGVIGSGTMGAGIAQLAIQQGFPVVLYDIDAAFLERSLNGIFSRIERLVEKGKLTRAECDEAKKRIRTTTDLTDLREVHVVIEAAPEKIEVKKDIFRKLDESCAECTILATNTSSLSVTEIAGATRRPDRVAGMHFFNPAPVMPLVELVRGIGTSEETMQTLLRFARQLKKDPVVCADTPGFIVNRVARPFYNEALRILGDKVASVEQIDRIMKKAGNFRMGPFELQDLIGIDINFATTETVHGGFFAEPRFRPHFYQQRMVQSGRLGRKTWRGYYEYDG